MGAPLVTQRLVNHFHPQSKLRNDPSTVGYGLMSVFGEYFDWAYADTKIILRDTRLLRRGLGAGHVDQVTLLEDDFMESTLGVGGVQTWTYPTVVGDAHAVARVETEEDLFWSAPNRVTISDPVGVEELVIYSDDRAGNVVVNTIDYPSALAIEVRNSTDYFKKTSLRNAAQSGQHVLVVTGVDYNYSDLVEYINVRDDGVYITQNVWSAITSIEADGFNGTITARYTPMSEDNWLDDPYRLCVLTDNEGPLKYQMSVYSADNGSNTKLSYYTDILKQGTDYRDGVDEVQPNVDEAWYQTLLDYDGEQITGLSMCMNPNTLRLYVLSDDDRVHVYDQSPGAFAAPSRRELLTATTYLELIPVQSYSLLNQSIKLFTRFVRTRFPILGVTLMRISPSDTVEYLQANKTWAAPTHEFNGTQVTVGFPEDSWQDFDFSSEATEFGQWEFYCTARTKYDTTVSYTSVLCDSLTAVASFDVAANSVGIFFDNFDQLVAISTTNGPDGEANSFYPVVEYSDKYLADPVNQILYLREHYSSVEIS